MKKATIKEISELRGVANLLPALISGSALASGSALISGSAQVSGSALVSGTDLVIGSELQSVVVQQVAHAPL